MLLGSPGSRFGATHQPAAGEPNARQQPFAASGEADTKQCLEGREVLASPANGRNIQTSKWNWRAVHEDALLNCCGGKIESGLQAQ
jgi:hypothetical protein